MDEDAKILRFFRFDHLPENLQSTSNAFSRLADMIYVEIPPSTERSFALRKLLEAKDCAVRAKI